jgi:hypothetical protein
MLDAAETSAAGKRNARARIAVHRDFMLGGPPFSGKTRVENIESGT